MADSEASLDEQLELKKRARRRLVGATALALLATLVLPMVMDREPRPPAQDIQVRIPSQDGGGIAARVLPTKPAATPLPPAAPVADAKPAPEPKAEPKTEPKTEPKPEAKPEPHKAEPAKAEVAKEAPKVAAAAPSAAKTPEKPAAKPPEKAADKPAEKKVEETRAADALSGGAGEQWVVQLGAYKEAGNVKLLLSKLKELGVPTYTEKFDSPQGPRTRVRAGPFPDREAAEKARIRVKIVGVDGPVAPK